MIIYYDLQILQNQSLCSLLASHHSGDYSESCTQYDLSLKMLILLYLKLSLRISFRFLGSTSI